MPPGPIRGRGAHDDPPNRFERLHLEPDPDADPEARPPDPRTHYLRDTARSALAHNQSPDVPFDTSLNPYRGCEHGCVYCYARPGHEYLGLSLGLDFETRIFVKQNAAELLEAELASPRWQPRVIAMSGVTDCYQPIERRLGITRRCLEVLARFRNPVGLITKSRLVVRDADLLAELASCDAAAVTLSITTLESDLARRMEPRAAQPGARLAAITALVRAGVPVGVNIAPVIPGLNDYEIPAILQAAADAGASWAAYLMLRLPFGVKQLFASWLDDHFPDRAGKVLSHIREVRGGELNDPHFASRMRGSGPFADQIADLFQLARRRAHLAETAPPLSSAAFRSPDGRQLTLF